MTTETALATQQYHEALVYVRVAQDALRNARKALGERNRDMRIAIGGHLHALLAVDESLRGAYVDLRDGKAR